MSQCSCWMLPSELAAAAHQPFKLSSCHSPHGEQSNNCSLSAAATLQHPYDECEVTAVDVTGGSESYLKWVVDSTALRAQGGPTS